MPDHGGAEGVMLPSRLCVRGLGSCAPVAARWNAPTSVQPMRQKRHGAARLVGLLHAGVGAVGAPGGGMFGAAAMIFCAWARKGGQVQKMIDQTEIHRNALSSEVEGRRAALNQIRDSFAYLPDKEKAWKDLIRLARDEDHDVRWGAAYALGSAFQHIPDKEAAWKDLHRLTWDEDSDVRRVAAHALGDAFPHIPDKKEAWKDLHRLKDEDSDVRRHAAVALDHITSVGGFPDAAVLPAPPDISEIIEDELKKSALGRILFNPPKEMKAAVLERVEVRIAKTITEDLTMGLRGRGEPKIEEIRVGTSMKARLTGDNFDITSPSTENQLVAGTGFTHWEWDVTPLKRGIQRLLLTVTVRIKIPNYDEEEKDYPVFEREIKVKVNLIHSTKNFMRSYWQWIVAMIVSSGIIGWIAKNL